MKDDTMMPSKPPPPSIYGFRQALLTDFYQLTMAHAYWKQGLTDLEAVFHLFYRRAPFQGRYALAAGLDSVIDYLEHFHFDASDLAYLEGLEGPSGEGLFDPAFLDYLGDMRFSCDVDAVPEGTVTFPYEPLLRVRGPLIQAQLLETPLLNQMNFPSLIATKAARVCLAAQGDEVLEFGLRRAQGADGGLSAARAAFIGGCSATSNVLAGKLYGIPVRGTHAHSWVMVFDDEVTAFQQYAEAMPDNSVFLVDTFNTLEGVKKAIEVGKWLKERGKPLLGIRLDSGDLAYLSIRARKLLDDAGFQDSKIVASNELDEHIIHELKQQGACISVWGVGTRLVTGGEQPALDGVYKLSAIRRPGDAWSYRLKLSEQMSKISNPGVLQVRRFEANGCYVADVLYQDGEAPNRAWTVVDPFDPTRRKLLSSELEAKDLLVPIFREGQVVYQRPSLNKIQSYARQELAALHGGIKRFLNPHAYVVGLEESLYTLKISLIEGIRHHEVPPPH
jgi:nicotinate phosphoribosyltransferase